MSKAEKDRFLADCEADTALKSKVMAMPGSSVEERIAAIRDMGYDLSATDFKAAGPMEDAALEDVAGGLSGWPWWFPLVFSPKGHK